MKNLYLLTPLEMYYLRHGVLRAHFERRGLHYMIGVIGL
jgi:hypothetical protein